MRAPAGGCHASWAMALAPKGGIGVAGAQTEKWRYGMSEGSVALRDTVRERLRLSSQLEQ